MMNPLTPRPDVFDAYWRFAAERQEIFFNRLQHLSPPWTDDPILQEFKFCNTYRASDRVSQFLIKEVIYQGSQREEEVLFRTLLFRMFNKIETWVHLQERLGEVSLANFDLETYGDLLEERLSARQTIFGNAFILCAHKAFGFDRKHLNFLALLRKMFFVDKLGDTLVRATRLEEIFRTLLAYPLLGNFMAYQMAVDLNYSDAINFSENDFTIAGPGAERGIKKCFASTGGKDKEYVIRWMVENQDREFERLGIDFKSLWGRPLHCIDCQGLFCETDKYSRKAFPELKSNRKRIKVNFKQTLEPIKFFYPPKWCINDQVSESQENYQHQLHTAPRQLHLGARLNDGGSTCTETQPMQSWRPSRGS